MELFGSMPWLPIAYRRTATNIGEGSMPYRSDAGVVVLFGAGQNSKTYLERHRDEHREYLLIDNNATLWGSRFAGLLVHAPSHLKQILFKEIVIAFAHAPEAIEQLELMGVPRAAITVPAKRATSMSQFESSEEREGAWRFLCEVLEALQELGVECIIEQGVALGFYRDGDFIAGDQDVDVSVSQDAIRSTDSIARVVEKLQNLSLVLAVEPIQGEQASTIKVTSRGGVPLGIFGRRTELGISRSSLPFEEVPDAFLNPPSWVTVRNRLVPLPNDCKRYLSHLYGSSWRVPNPDFTFLDYANILK